MEVKASLPLLPLRDIVVFPSMIIPLFVGRDKSISALNEVMKNDKKIILVTQKNSEVDDPKKDDIYMLGCEGNILQLLKLPDGTVKVLVEGTKRVKILDFIENEKFITCNFSYQSDQISDNENITPLALTAVRRLEKLTSINKKISNETINKIKELKDPSIIADNIASHLNTSISEKQQIFELIDVKKKLNAIINGVVFFTLIFAIKAIKAQQAIKQIEPKVKALQEKYKDNRQELGVKLMELYRENNVSPFASFGLILVQIPIIFGLYYIVLRSGLLDIDPARLYTFVSEPGFTPSPLLFGVLDVAQKSLPLALMAGIAQYIQTRIALPKTDPASLKTPQEQMMSTITTQMKYVFPVLITVIAYTLSAAVALYFVTSNIFHIMQELYVKKRGIKDQSPVAFDV